MPSELQHAAIARSGKRSVDTAALEKLGWELLVALGEDPREARLQGTPGRFARMWRDFIERPNDGPLTCFAHEHADDQMVVVSGMRVWSFCEHHLLPFWCDISIGYIPQAKVLGLSKFGRIAHANAARLQIQERLVRDIADDVHIATESKDVAVIAHGEHLCMTMRGVRTNATMTSSVLNGRFKEGPMRAEFLALVARA
jgi:GTP cyclohydrolase I